VKDFIHFALVGASGFVFATMLLYALAALGLDFYSGYAIAFVATATLTWWFNRKFTFDDQSLRIIHQWIHYMAFNAVAGTVNYLVFAGLISFVEVVQKWPVLGTGAGALAGLAVNFITSRRYVFTQRSRDRPQ